MEAHDTFTLTVVHPKMARPIQYSLRPGRYLVGSAIESDILLQHAYVSEQHARLECTAGACTLTDLKSTNGTYLNGLRLPPEEPVPIRPEDTVEIGLFQLTIEPVAETAESEDKAEASGTAVVAEAAVATAMAAGSAGGDGDDGKSGPPTVILKGSSENFPRNLKRLGLERNHSRYLQYLPALYDTPFMRRFLALFESILAPTEWTVDNLALYLDPDTAPAEFLPWLAQWYKLTYDHTWNEEQRRCLLKAAPGILNRWGTKKALSKILEIYTGVRPVIDDGQPLPPFTFRVSIRVAEATVDREALERLIDEHKPAYTSYELVFTGPAPEEFPVSGAHHVR